MNRLKNVRFVNIDMASVARTLAVLQHYGDARCEGLVLWVGEVAGEHAHVQEVWVPQQRAIRSEQGVGYFVEADVLFELNRQLAASKLRLIGQVHSHPSEAFHSETDDEYAIVTTEGGLSLVVPDFGRAPPEPASWAVYRLLDGRWTALTRAQAKQILRIRAVE